MPVHVALPFSSQAGKSTSSDVTEDTDRDTLTDVPKTLHYAFFKATDQHR
jgi:hypothetical protein